MAGYYLLKNGSDSDTKNKTKVSQKGLYFFTMKDYARAEKRKYDKKCNKENSHILFYSIVKNFIDEHSFPYFYTAINNKQNIEYRYLLDHQKENFDLMYSLLLYVLVEKIQEITIIDDVCYGE